MRSKPAAFSLVRRIAVPWVVTGLVLTACAPSKLHPLAVVPLGSAEEAVAYFKAEENKIKAYRAAGKIRPASGAKFTQVDLMVRLDSDRMSLAGITPFGLPLFRVTTDENGVSVHGLESLGFLPLGEGNFRDEIGLLREVLDVYHMEGDAQDPFSLMENETHYILSRIRLSPGCFISSPEDRTGCWGFPVRTYWVAKETRYLVKKEIYVRNKKGEEEKILTVEYSDFRPVSLSNLPGEVMDIPFAIVLKDKRGKPLGEVIFHEVRLDDEDPGT